MKLNNNKLSLHIGTEEQKITLDKDRTAMLKLVKKEDVLSALHSFYKFNSEEYTPKERENAFQRVCPGLLRSYKKISIIINIIQVSRQQELTDSDNIRINTTPSVG